MQCARGIVLSSQQVYFTIHYIMTLLNWLVIYCEFSIEVKESACFGTWEKWCFVSSIIEFYKLSKEAGSEVPITYIPCVLQICP